MRLDDKLIIDFVEWLSNDFKGSKDHDTDCYIYNSVWYLPLSLQFNLLCQFLEETGKLTGYAIGQILEGGHMVKIWGSDFNEMGKFQASTKEEAITKAIQYLNDNY